MKKLAFGVLTACLLLLTACQPRPAPEGTPSLAPTPAQSQTAEAPPVTPAPKGTPVFPAFLEEFNFPKVEALVLGGSSLEYTHAWLTEAELAELKASLQMDSWREATDLPEMGLDPRYLLSSGEEDPSTSRTFLVTEWDEEKCLILAKYWDGRESYSYYAPASVLETFEEYLSGKNLLPDFVRYFEMDQVNIDRTLADDGGYYLNHNVYLLDDETRLSMLAALAPDTWTAARDTNELAVNWSSTLELLDTQGNRVILADWNEEKCLVNCFYTDSDLRYGNTGTGAVVCYWAPASVLKNARDLVDSLTPLGVVESEKERYFDLFRSDPGFDLLLDNRAMVNGAITDDQIAAYILTVLGYEGLIDYEIGVSKETFDEVAFKHFGRKMGSYETDWSKVLPSGNVTATGWDSTSGFYPILTGAPTVNQNGSITATFRVYTLWEDLWLEELLPAFQLNHAGEHLLTGNDRDFLAAGSSVSTVEITFRIEAEEVNGAQREYVVYDALRLLEEYNRS